MVQNPRGFDKKKRKKERPLTNDVGTMTRGQENFDRNGYVTVRDRRRSECEGVVLRCGHSGGVMEGSEPLKPLKTTVK